MTDVRPSKYCALCVADAAVINGIAMVDFGTVSAVSTVATMTTDDTTSTGSFSGEVNIDAKYGRTLSVVSDTASTTQKVTVSGYDFYDQPMTEEFTLNGKTAVAGKKAFKTVTEISLAAGAAQTVTVSTALKLGLPFRATKLLAGLKDGVEDTSNQTLTVGYNTTQTATSNDPRGVVAIAAGAHKYSSILVVSKDTFTISGKEVGGLQGIPHYSA